MGGRWLFVSHDPILVPEGGGGKDLQPSLMRMFGLSSRKDDDGEGEGEGRGRGGEGVVGRRFVRFAFEPMLPNIQRNNAHHVISIYDLLPLKARWILHIATASLHHASPILKAAIAAGFRESGVQSLKNLYDAHALPMVAVRSAGLAFESVIGRAAATGSSSESRLPDHPIVVGGKEEEAEYGSEQWKDGEAEEVIEALVDESYLEMLVGVANERFKANTERMKRFESILFAEEGKGRGVWEWEDKEKRKERKRSEGLRRREEEVNGDRRVEDAENGEGNEDAGTGIGDLDALH
ncbi:MAG: hypothetical protein Q9201_007557 [Fulgogasparrea decipioides]